MTPNSNATLFPTASETIHGLSNGVKATGGRRTIAHLDGQPVTAGSIAALACSQNTQLNGDEGLTVVRDGDLDDFTFTDGVESRALRAVRGGLKSGVHSQFDRHQVAFAEGLETGTGLPAPKVTGCYECQSVEGLYPLFPETSLRTGSGLSPLTCGTPTRSDAQPIAASAWAASA